MKLLGLYVSLPKAKIHLFGGLVDKTVQTVHAHGGYRYTGKFHIPCGVLKIEGGFQRMCILSTSQSCESVFANHLFAIQGSLTFILSMMQ